MALAGFVAVAPPSAAKHADHDHIVAQAAGWFGALHADGTPYQVGVPGASASLLGSVGDAAAPRLPDLVAYRWDGRGAELVRFAEVETAAGVSLDRAWEWKRFGDAGLELVLLVPPGTARRALKCAAAVGARVAEVYEYVTAPGGVEFAKFDHGI